MIDLRRLDSSITALQQGPLSEDRGFEIASTIAEYRTDAVLPLLVFLSEHSGPNRQYALSAFQTIGNAATPRLADYLRTDPRLRGASASALAYLGTEEAVRVLEGVLRADSAAAKTMRQRRLLLRIASCTLAVILLVSAVFMLFGNTAQRLPGKCFILVAAGLVVGGERFANYKPAAIAALGESGDGRLAVTLVPFLSDDKEAARAAAASLVKLMPLVSEADANSFTATDIDLLVQVLGGRDHDLIKAILAALPIMGDETALPAVERLAIGDASGRNYEIRLAAEACLPALRARIELQRKANTLLRPSTELASPLLRPAANARSDEPKLVRPVDAT